MEKQKQTTPKTNTNRRTANEKDVRGEMAMRSNSGKQNKNKTAGKKHRPT